MYQVQLKAGVWPSSFGSPPLNKMQQGVDSVGRDVRIRSAVPLSIEECVGYHRFCCRPMRIKCTKGSYQEPPRLYNASNTILGRTVRNFGSVPSAFW